MPLVFAYKLLFVLYVIFIASAYAGRISWGSSQYAAVLTRFALLGSAYKLVIGV